MNKPKRDFGALSNALFCLLKRQADSHLVNVLQGDQ